MSVLHLPTDLMMRCKMSSFAYRLDATLWGISCACLPVWCCLGVVSVKISRLDLTEQDVSSGLEADLMFNNERLFFVPRHGSKLKPFPCRIVCDFDFSFCFAVQRMCGVGLPFGCQTSFETGNLLVRGEGQSTSRTFWNFWSCPQCRRWSFLDFRVWNGAFWSVWPVDGHDETLHVSL